ncbi:hypothetical protein [Microvirga sp. 2TAF3]|uniref:hypothetical protein n=1 Tax=Microvirga sp. 2TAF3 TaxID=3233014 RepID=UPI003F9CAF40
MELIVFSSRKGGAARTTCSVQLAAGAHKLGWRPLHIQVLPSGRFPVLNRVKQIPFETALVMGDDINAVAAQIRFHASIRPKCRPIIVDTPVQTFRETMTMLGGMEARILLPMRSSELEVDAAIMDYQEYEDTLARQAADQQRPTGWRAPVSVLPVGWPSSFEKEDFAAFLARRGLVLDDARRLSVVVPGTPYLDHLDLWSSRIGSGSCFHMEVGELDAATMVAGAVLGGSGTLTGIAEEDW